MLNKTLLSVAAGLILPILAVAENNDAAQRPAPLTLVPRLERASTSQLVRLDEKVGLVTQILDRVAADAARKGATNDWRQNLAASLYRLPNESLQAIAPGIATLDDAHAAAASAAAVAADSSLGSGNDLVFTPISPCRFVDTRNVGGGIVGGSVRVFDTANPGSTYGGSASCALSGVGEPALALNVTIASPTAAGYLVLRPQGSTNVTSFINWGAGTVQLANAGIISTSLATNGHYEFEVTGNKGSPQMIVDLFGYFSVPSGTITGDGGAADGVAGTTSGAFNSGVYGNNTGGGKGVFGASASGQGVVGQSNTGTGTTGVSASGSGVYGSTAGTSGQSGAAGVWGDSHNYYGVWGTSVSGDGIHGNSSTASGVYGISGGAGAWGESTGYDGVHGHTSNPAGNASGLAGFGDGSNNGVFGHSDAGYGMTTDGPAQQALNQGGWVKAMVVVAPASTGSGTHIVRCFNARLPAAQASSPPCGMVESEPTTGNVQIDFGFDVRQRFVAATTLFSTGVTIAACNQSDGCGGDSGQVTVSLYVPSQSSYVDVPFTLIVY